MSLLPATHSLPEAGQAGHGHSRKRSVKGRFDQGTMVRAISSEVTAKGQVWTMRDLARPARRVPIKAGPDLRVVQASLAQLTWYHRIALIEKLHNPESRLWYAALAFR